MKRSNIPIVYYAFFVLACFVSSRAQPSECDNYLESIRPHISSPKPIVCNGNSTTLVFNPNPAATGEYNRIQWYLNGNEIVGATSSTYEPAFPGIYTVEAGNWQCSTRTRYMSEVYEIKNFSQAVTIDGRSGVSPGNPTTLTAQPPGMSYQWSNGATSQSISVNTVGSYSVAVTNPDGCTGSATKQVYNCVPILTANHTSLCQGAVTINLTNTTYTNVRWYKDGQIIPGVAGNTTITTSDAGTYYLELTSLNCGGMVRSNDIVVTSPTTVPASITGNTTVPVGGTTTLTAQPGGMTYAWTTGSTNPSITVGAGTYSVTVTNSEGCSATASATVTENASCAVTVQASNNGVICPGNSVNLTIPNAVDFTGFQWQRDGVNINGATGVSYNATTVGAYSVVVSSATCGSLTSSPVTLTASSVTASISGNLTIPAGATTTLTGEPSGMSYSWSTGATTRSITVGAGTFLLTVTDASGCSAAASATVVENASCPLDLQASNGGVICSGSAVTLSINDPSPFTSFQWQRDGVNITGATSAIYSAIGPGSYTVTASSAACGTQTSSAIDVTASSLSASVTGTTTIPVGGTTTLTAQPAGMTYTWSNGQTTQSINVGAGNYSVTVRNPEGCTSNANVTVTENASCTPNVAVTNNGVLCNGAAVTLSVTNASSYTSFQWRRDGTNINGATNATLSANVVGEYTVIVNSASCGSVTSGSVDLTTSAVAASIAGNTTIAPGGTTTLTASGGVTYLWSNGSTSPTITVAAGTYSVTATAGDGCSATASVTVVENTACNPVIQGTNGGNICSGSSVTLSITNVTNFVSFQWRLNGTNISGATGQTYSATAAGSYSVQAVSTPSAGCGTVTSTPFSVSSSSVSATITGNTTVPAGGTTTLTAMPAGLNYVWSNGATSQSITVGVGSYSVTVTNTQGCSGTANVTVIENAACSPSVQASNGGVICGTGSVNLSITNAGSFTGYQWQLNGTNINGATSATYSATGAGAYTVIANSASCGSVTSSAINVTASSLTASITGNTNIPTGGTTTLTANPAGMTYLWSDGSTGQSINVGAGSYSVTVTNGQGCTSTANATVTTNAACAATIQSTNAGVICGTGSVTLTLSNAGSFTGYQWQRDGVNINGATAATYTATSAGAYTMIATSAGCGTVTSPAINVTVSSVNASITGNTAVPTGGTTTLTAMPAGMTYLWSDGSTGQTINVGVGTYTVTITNGQGCSATANATVTTNAACAATIQSTNGGVICGTGSATLTLNNAGSFTGYQWQRDGININGARAATYNATTAGAYTMVATSAGCGTVTSPAINVTVSSVNASITGNTTVPTGGTTTLTAMPAGMTYLWSDGSTGQTINVGAGSYSVTVTNAQGCTSTANATVTTNAACAATIQSTNGGVICGTGSVTLSLTNPATFTGYQWQRDGVNINGATAATYTASTAGAYTVMGNSTVCGSVTSSAINVTISSVTASITGNTIIASGGTTTLTAMPAGMTYLWSDGSTGQTINVGVGSYSVTVTNAQGCTGIANATVTQAAPCSPTIQATNGGVICGSGSVTLTLGNPGSFTGYQWQRDGVDINGATTSSFTANSAGAYTVVATSASCGSVTSAAVNVTVSSFTALISGNTTVTTGGTTTLTAMPAGMTYLWSDGSTGQSITVGPGTYSVTVTSTQGCTGGANATVTVNATCPASIQSTNGGVICGNASVILSLNNPGSFTSYQWQRNGVNINGATAATYTASAAGSYSIVASSTACGSVTSSSINVTVSSLSASITGNTTIPAGGTTILTAQPTGMTYLWSTGSTAPSITVGAGTYTVTVTNGDGCSATVNTTVTEIPTCSITVSIKATANGNGGITLTAEPAGLSYLWSDGQTTATISETPRSTKTFSVTATDNNNCTGTASYTYNYNPGSNKRIITVNASTSLCEGQSIILSAPDGYDTYLWNPGQSTTKNITISPASGNHVYSLTAINANTIEYDTIHVKVSPNPVAGIDASLNTDGSWTLVAKPDNMTYSWSNGATTNAITVTSAGSHSVKVTNQDGCSSQTTYQVTGCVMVTPSITTQGNSAICGNAPVKLLAASVTPGTWQWYKDGLAINGQTNNAYDATAEGDYSVELIASCGKKLSPSFNVKKGTELTGELIVSPTSVDYGNKVHMSANIKDAISYNWHFGDGAVAQSNNPAIDHYYYVSGTLLVKLLARNADGCVLELQKEITVKSDQPTVTNPTNGAYKLNVFPSPYRDRLYVTFNLEKDSKVLVDVATPAGASIYRIELNGRAGNNKFLLSGMEQLTSNVTYLIKVRIEGKTFYDKVLKY